MKYQRPPYTYVSQISLKVADLDRSVAFYQNEIGLRIIEKTGKSVRFTANGNDDLLTIEQPEDVVPLAIRTTGLYHVAILLPNRASLADQLKHFQESGTRLMGASDHHVSEAIYLEDPDGNGIEMYSDRQYIEPDHMGTAPLDVGDLLKESSGKKWNGVPPDTVIGHIHIKVADILTSIDFYRNIIGFDLIMKIGDSAAFLSTGGYHHHLGMNTWESAGGKKPLPNSVGLKHLTLVLPDQKSLDSIRQKMQNDDIPFRKEEEVLEVEDPSGNLIRLTVFQ
jgi:catechol 2,3-dioxygenase